MTDKFLLKNKNLDIYKMTDIDFKKFLYKNKIWNKKPNDFYTHTAMGDFKGCLLFNRDELTVLFNNVNKEKNRYFGITEFPRYYSMFRLDFDFDEKKTNLKPLYNIDTYLNQVIPQIQKDLKSVIIDYRPEMTDAVILTKDPYIKNGVKIKHGLHIVFPNLFISIEHFKFFEKKFLKSLDGYDSTITKPWLLYGQSKSRESGYYQAYKVLTEDGFILEPEDYFNDYSVYDRNEKKIDFGENVKDYYPNIFSIFPYGRPVSELRVVYDKEIKPKRETKKVELNITDDEQKKLIYNLVFILSKDRATARDSWRDVGFCIFNLLGEEGLDLFLEFSQKSEDYDEDGCVRFYERITHGDIGLGSLIFWANEDNKREVTILLQKIKKEEPKEEFKNINTECESYSTIAKCYSGDDKDWAGKTYGALIENKDYTNFIHWIINNGVQPHCNHFKRILGMEIEEFKILPYETIKADKVICEKNVGDYTELLKTTHILCIKSNMGTFKTQNLKKLFSQYRRILITTFRRSLASEFLQEFGEYGFKSYEDFNGKIKEDRIICQIDSLFKVRGEFDLVIHDEIVGTIEHLHSFVKEKEAVCNAFNQFNKTSERVIILDALLDNNSIDLMKGYGKKVFVLENTFKTLTHKKYEIRNYSNQSNIWLDILEFSKKGSVFIPTNSNTFATKLELYLKNEGVNVALDNGESDDNIPTNEWKNYRVFITTPTNVAGVSCNDFFDYCCPIFTNNSCNALMAGQMMRRVRNIKCDTYYIYDITRNIGGYNPITKHEILDMLNKRQELYLKVNFTDDKKSKLYFSDLDVDYKTDKLKETPYVKSFVNHIKKMNQSKIWFFQVLRGVLDIHGLTEIDYDEDEREMDKDELKEIKENVKKMKEDKKMEQCRQVAISKDITEEEYEVLSNKTYKKKAEKDCMLKYDLRSNYKIQNINRYVVYHLGDKINIFKNLCRMNCDNLEDMLLSEIKSSAKYLADKSDIEKLHYKRNIQKIHEVYNIIKEIGFKNIFGEEILNNLDYEKMHKYFRENSEYHKLLFNCNTSKVMTLDKEDKGYKRSILNFINNKLKPVCGLSVSNKDSNTRKGRNNPEYYLKGLEIWNTFRIKIEKYECKYNNVKVYSKNDSFMDIMDELFSEEIEVC